MTRPEPIEDYYGVQLDVQPIMASPGPMVDLDVRTQQRARVRGTGADDFYRLTPEQAVELGKRLIAAGEEGCR